MNSKREGRFSVGHWLVLLLVVFFVGPMLLSNVWGYLQSKRYLTEAAFRNIRNVAALEASETDEFVRNAHGLLPSLIAGNQHLYGLLRALQKDDPDGRESVERNLRIHLAAKADESDSVKEFLVVSPSGELLASSSGRRSEAASFRSQCLEQGRRKSGIFGIEYPPAEAGGPHAGAHAHGGGENGDPLLLVAAPVPDERGGGLLGVLCARFEFDIHRSLLLAHRQRTQHAMIYLLDDKAQIICGSFDDMAAAPFGQTLELLAHPKFSRREPWEARNRVSQGDEVMMAYAPLDQLGWGIVVEVPVVRALADLERLKWQAMGGSVGLAAVLGLAAVVSWRMFVRPVRALSGAADRLAGGATGATVDLEGPREFNELAVAFNRMSLALRESQDTLESRIADRTHELRRSQEFSELLLDSIEQRVIVLDHNCRIIKANRTALHMQGDDLVGRTCCEAFEGLSDASPDCPARRTFETGEPVTDERSQRTLRGVEPMYVSTYPVLDEAGAVGSVVEVARVVTAEKRLQMQMAYQEKLAAFGQLAAGVAHEIGNPLAAIESQLQLAKRDPNRADQTLDIVASQVGRMNRMLRRLVGFTRRKRDEAVLASVNQSVEDVAQLLEHDPRARSVTIARDLGEHLPGVRAKEDDLVQVLLNLGLNALHAMDGSGTLTFESKAADGQVAVYVRDTGSGIPEDVRSHIFDPFFTTKGPTTGTGLGLFVSRSIVEALGGSLELERSGPDGTAFVVRIPQARKSQGEP